MGSGLEERAVGAVGGPGRRLRGRGALGARGGLLGLGGVEEHGDLLLGAREAPAEAREELDAARVGAEGLLELEVAALERRDDLLELDGGLLERELVHRGGLCHGWLLPLWVTGWWVRACRPRPWP